VHASSCALSTRTHAAMGEPGVTAVLVIDAFGAESVSDPPPEPGAATLPPYAHLLAAALNRADAPDAGALDGEAVASAEAGTGGDGGGDGDDAERTAPPVRFGEVHGGGTQAALQYARLLLAFATPVRVKVLLATADGLMEANTAKGGGADTSQSLSAVRGPTLDPLGFSAPSVLPPISLPFRVSALRQDMRDSLHIHPMFIAAWRSTHALVCRDQPWRACMRRLNGCAEWRRRTDHGWAGGGARARGGAHGAVGPG